MDELPENKITLPSYKEIFQEIGRELNQRKGFLARRIVLIAWPGIVAAFLSWLPIYSVRITGEIENPLMKILGIMFGVWLIFLVFYYCIMTWIFDIEKKLWVINHFDKKSINSKDSWRNARKLSGPVFRFGMKLFMRFYAPIIIFLIVLIGSGIVIMSSSAIPNYSLETILYIFIGILIIGTIGFAIYFYIINIKLRFVWFIFLKNFNGKSLSLKAVLDENGKMINVTRDDSFKKALLINLGADSLMSLAQSVFELIREGFSRLGGIGPGVGLAVQAAGEEASKQVIDFGKIVANYVLYRYAYIVVYQKEPEVNDFLYNLN